MSETLDRTLASPPPPPPVPNGGQDRLDALRLALEALKAGNYAEVLSLSGPYAANGDLDHALTRGVAIALDGDVEGGAVILAAIGDARPDASHPIEDIGRLMREQDREGDALPHAEAAARLRPDDPRSLRMLGAMLNYHFRPAEAERALRRSNALAPGDATTLNQLGIAMIDQGDHDGAREAFAEATAVDPTSNVGWTNFACALATGGRFDEALEYYRRSITLRPDNAAIRLNYAICLLKAGRMVHGWAEYEWRLKLPGHTQLPRDRMLPNIGPDDRLDGQIVLVTHEEGLGDTLQFMRYLASLRDRGAEVRAWVPAPVRSLIAQIQGVTAYSGEVDPLLYSVHCPFLSLPRALSATSDALPTEPYITPDPALVRAMAGHMPDGDGRDLRVGLVWGGAPRPDIRAANAVDRRRSMGVKPLGPLRTLSRVQFVSLQLGPYRDQLRDLAPGLEIHDPMDVVRDMHDTAALIAHLDVVVSVDTSTVHLAAGMGKPTILLDRFDNCWRWLSGRDDSPFYPSLRIIRQKRQFDWDGSIARLVVVLRMMAEQKRRGRTPSLHGAINAITPYAITIPT